MWTLILQVLTPCVEISGLACHKKTGSPIFGSPGPNISKYLDPPDNLFQFC